MSDPNELMSGEWDELKLSDDEKIIADQGLNVVVDTDNYQANPNRKKSKSKHRTSQRAPSGSPFLQPPHMLTPAMQPSSPALKAYSPVTNPAGSPLPSAQGFEPTPAHSHQPSPYAQQAQPVTTTNVPPLFKFFGAVADKTKQFFGGEPDFNGAAPGAIPSYAHTPVTPGADLNHSPYNLTPKPSPGILKNSPLRQQQTLLPDQFSQPPTSAYGPPPGAQPGMLPFSMQPPSYSHPPPYSQSLGGGFQQYGGFPQPQAYGVPPALPDYGGFQDPYSEGNYFESRFDEPKKRKHRKKSKKDTILRPAGWEFDESESEDEEPAPKQHDLISSQAPILVLLVAGGAFMLTRNRPPIDGVVSQTLNSFMSSVETFAIIAVVISILVLVWKAAGTPKPPKSEPPVLPAGSGMYNRGGPSSDKLYGTELDYTQYTPTIGVNNMPDSFSRMQYGPAGFGGMPGYPPMGGLGPGLPMGGLNPLAGMQGFPGGLPMSFSGIPGMVGHQYDDEDLSDEEEEEVLYYPGGETSQRSAQIPKKAKKPVSPLVTPFKIPGVSNEMVEEENKPFFYEPMPPLPGIDDPTYEPSLYDTLKKGPNKDLLKKAEEKKGTDKGVVGKGKSNERIESTTKKAEEFYVDDYACKPYGPPPKRYRGVNS